MATSDSGSLDLPGGIFHSEIPPPTPIFAVALAAILGVGTSRRKVAGTIFPSRPVICTPRMQKSELVDFAEQGGRII